MAEPNERPEWLRTVLREAPVRRGLILYGNVRDLFFDEARKDYVSLPELLLRRLTDVRAQSPYTLASTWDQVDGLRFASEQHERRYKDVTRKYRASAEPVGGSAYDMGAPPAPSPAGELAGNIGDVLIRFRQLLSTQGERPLLIADWSHLLVTQPAHPDAAERTWMTRMGKALVGEPAHRIDSDTLREGAGGLLILLAATLGALPPGLYLGDARVRLVAVPAPTRAERRSFFQRHADELDLEAPRPTAGAAAPVSPRATLPDTLADLTDELSLVDLKQLLTLSKRAGKLPAERLLNLYRFGEQRSPWEELSEARVRQVKETLTARVIGQDDAVDHVATMIVRAYMGLAGLQHSARRSKPKGTLFFVGPTGVGKTELAKACAEFLFGDESACIRFDMSEFNHEHSDQRLIGAPPGYVGFEEGGQLTNAVRRRPFSVLLFDEIEKAHGRVLDKFLQILEDGRLTDGRGETAHFSECVLIFTSNIGASDVKTDATREQRRAHFLTAVEKHFVQKLQRPELLNRFGDNIVAFDLIDAPEVRRGILHKKLKPLHTYLQERWGVRLRLAPPLEAHYLNTARPEHGGRGLLNALERDLLNPLAWFLFEHRPKLRAERTIEITLSEEGRPEFELIDG